MTEFKELKKKIRKHFLSYANRLHSYSLVVKIAFVLFGALISGYAQLNTTSNPPSLIQIAGEFGTALVFIGGIFVVITEHDASVALASAQEALDYAKEVESQLNLFDKWKADIDRAIELYSAMKAMRHIIQGSIGSHLLKDSEIIKFILEASERHLKIALDFKINEIWTLCVYKAELQENKKSFVLKCIAHERSIKCDMHLARDWPEGIGIAGGAFIQDREVIVPDLTSPQLGTLYDLTSRAAPRDNERYRSIVAVPIRPFPEGPLYGMVVATSSRAGHFHTDTGHGVRPVEAARALAGMIGLAVRIPRSLVTPLA